MPDFPEQALNKVRIACAIRPCFPITFPISPSETFNVRTVSFSLSKNKFSDGWFDIESVRLIPSFVLLKFEGIDVVEEARYFVGGEVQVSREEACCLLDNEFYACDLCLCSLVFNGVSVGKIVNVVDAAGVLLEVVKSDGKVCYVPFNNEFIGMVNIESRLVELKKNWILE